MNEVCMNGELEHRVVVGSKMQRGRGSRSWEPQNSTSCAARGFSLRGFPRVRGLGQSQKLGVQVPQNSALGGLR